MNSQAEVDEFALVVERIEFDQIILDGETIVDTSSLDSLSLVLSSTLDVWRTSLTSLEGFETWQLAGLHVFGNADLTTVDLPAAQDLFLLEIDANPALTSVSLSGLQALATLAIDQTPLLCELNLGVVADPQPCALLQSYACEGEPAITAGCD